MLFDPHSGSLTEAEDEVEGAPLLDLVEGKGEVVVKLLCRQAAYVDETLLIKGDSLLFVNLLLHTDDGIGGLDVKGDGLPGQSFNINLKPGRKEHGNTTPILQITRQRHFI